MKYQEKYSYGGWKNCIYIDNGSISLVATADVGPRIMSFGFMDGLNVFHEDAADLGIINDNKWRIYGGTRLWHAPESLPRTYYPDNKPVKYHWNGEQLKLIQPKETTTGLQKEIIIKVSENQDMASIIYRIYNLNLWPVKFACWALSVMKQNGEVVVPHEPFQDHSENLLPARPLVLWRYTDMKDKRWEWGSRYIRLRQDPSTESSQKIGVLNKTGWSAYSLQGNIFIKTFKFIENMQYPDFNSNVEIYTDKNIIELETLGPLVEVQPGAFTEHMENWYIFKDMPEIKKEDEKSLHKLFTGLCGRIMQP